MLDPEFVLDADARRRLIDRFGPGAGPWCDRLAGLVEVCCRRWGLDLDEVLSGGTSRVFFGRQDGGRPVVLKLTPDRSIAESEAITLRAWARTPHAVDLLESEPEAGALLLARVTPGTKAAALPALPPFEDFAELIDGLRAADGQDAATLRSSIESVDFIYGLIARRAADSHVRRFVAADVVARGHALARELAASTDDYGLVHGDLHLFNILDGGPGRGLVAIDPRSSCGDRTWDAIDIALARVTSTDELDDRISRITGLVPGLNAGRLRQWCQATAVISVVQRLFHRRHDGGAVPDKFLLDLAASVYRRLRTLAAGPTLAASRTLLVPQQAMFAQLRPVPGLADPCGQRLAYAGTSNEIQVSGGRLGWPGTDLRSSVQVSPAISVATRRQKCTAAVFSS